MNSRQRLTRIFEGKKVDRPALKLWGLKYGQRMLHRAYKPVYDLAMELTDVMDYTGSRFDIMLGAGNQGMVSKQRIPVEGSNWVDEYTYIQLPDRKLRSIFRYSLIDEPGYSMEYLVKEPGDLRALLDIDYKPYPVSTDEYFYKNKIIGDRGIVMYGLDHASYSVIRMMGSQQFAFMSFDDRELLGEAVDIYTSRIIEHVKEVLSAGILPIFGWVGPELCIPPLAGMNDFEDFVFNYDKKICDLIHNAGSNVWVHCHGSVGKLLDRFIDMGVDVLNPIEPPPQGDITLVDAIEKVKGRMGLEGNIEISSLLLEPPEKVIELIDETVREGKKSSRFIMCPSAGYMEYVNPSQQYIENLMIYLKRGYERLSEGI